MDNKKKSFIFYGYTSNVNFNLENTSIGIRYAGKSIGLALAGYSGLASASFISGKMVENLFTLVSHCGAMWVLRPIDF